MKNYFVKIFFLVLITISSVLFLSTIEVGVKKPEGFAVGSYLANAMMPIFTIIGSVIVYYAFVAQLKANRQVQLQFKEQSFENLFFRLLDNLTFKVDNFTTRESIMLKQKGYQVLRENILEMKSKMNGENIRLGNKTIFTRPHFLSEEDWQELFDFRINEFRDQDHLKSAFLNANHSEKTAIVNTFILNNSKELWEESLIDIGIRNFLNHAISVQREYHMNLFSQTYQDNISFYDGYFRTIQLILNHLDTYKDNIKYIEYLDLHLTNDEKILIFMHVARGGNMTVKMRKQLKKYNILESLSNNKYSLLIPFNNDSDENYLYHINRMLSVKD